MMLKPEVVLALEREQRVCEMAIDRLEERSRPFEQQYGWSTDQFLRKFNDGEIGDDKSFFFGTRWLKPSLIGEKPATV